MDQRRRGEEWAFPVVFAVLALGLWVLIIEPATVVATWTSDSFWLWVGRIALLFGIASFFVAAVAVILGWRQLVYIAREQQRIGHALARRPILSFGFVMPDGSQPSFVLGQEAIVEAPQQGGAPTSETASLHLLTENLGTGSGRNLVWSYLFPMDIEVENAQVVPREGKRVTLTSGHLHPRQRIVQELTFKVPDGVDRFTIGAEVAMDNEEVDAFPLKIAIRRVPA